MWVGWGVWIEWRVGVSTHLEIILLLLDVFLQTEYVTLELQRPLLGHIVQHLEVFTRPVQLVPDLKTGKVTSESGGACDMRKGQVGARCH